jgi:hypothetical protein
LDRLAFSLSRCPKNRSRRNQHLRDCLSAPDSRTRIGVSFGEHVNGPGDRHVSRLQPSELLLPPLLARNDVLLSGSGAQAALLGRAAIATKDTVVTPGDRVSPFRAKRGIAASESLTAFAAQQLTSRLIQRRRSQKGEYQA